MFPSRFQQALGEARFAVLRDGEACWRAYDGLVARYGHELTREVWRLACNEADALVSDD